MKSLFDYTIATLALVLFLPFLIIVAIAIKLDSKGPIFYRQIRMGQHGKKFKIFKFRTMTGTGSTLTMGTSDPRITRVGRIIRGLHLDEFAQLINILKGEMSLVGPRPEVPEFTEFYKDQWEIVLTNKPGITGLAALKCADYEYKTLANATDPKVTYIKKILPKKLRYDCFYASHRSIWFDVLILTWTAKRFLGIRS